MKKLIPILLILLIITGCTKKEENKPISTTSKKGNTTTTKAKPIYKYYEHLSKQGDEQYVEKLYLLNDGTFWFIDGFANNPEYIYGTYEDNILTSKKAYSTARECYYEDDYKYTMREVEGEIFLGKEVSKGTKIEIELYPKENDEPITNIIKDLEEPCSE